jgi:hypothetical protein
MVARAAQGTGCGRRWSARTCRWYHLRSAREPLSLPPASNGDGGGSKATLVRAAGLLRWVISTSLVELGQANLAR